MSSMDSLAPISMKAWKRNMSPRTNPTIPERKSALVASIVKGMFLNPSVMKKLITVMITKETSSRMRFKTRDPTFFPVYSKVVEESTQQSAVPKAANSPIYILHILNLIRSLEVLEEMN